MTGHIAPLLPLFRDMTRTNKQTNSAHDYLLRITGFNVCKVILEKLTDSAA